MVIVTADSAMRLLSQEGLYGHLGTPVQSGGWAWSRPTMSDVNDLKAIGLNATGSDPLHILVKAKAERVQSKRVLNHIWSGRIPPGSLHYLAPGAAICSPEFCFLQAARHGPIAAAAVGWEACGLYGRDASSRGFADRGPISSVEAMARYLAGASGAYGIKNAREALGQLVEGSRSPLETKVALILTAPVEQGGYGLPNPKCNWLVERDPEHTELSYESYYLIDLCWPEQKVSLECDSYAYHLNRDSLDHDAQKRNALVSNGWVCLSATQGQLSGAGLDTLARQLSWALGRDFEQPEARQRDELLKIIP